MRSELGLKGLIGFGEQTLGRQPQEKGLYEPRCGEVRMQHTTEERNFYWPGRLRH